MSETAGSAPFELTIEAGNDDYDAGDERWRSQVVDLYNGLDDEVGEVRRDLATVPGAKGGAASVILALGSAGAFTAAVQYFKSWLGRDKSRRLEVSWEVDGRKESVSVSGDAMSEEAMATLAKAAAQRLGGEDQEAPAGDAKE